MNDLTAETEGTFEPHGVRAPKKAALAGWIGSAVEYYDFFIYGAAAGPGLPARCSSRTADPADRHAASFATFGVAYVARPIGAVIIGHFGDTVGRKKMLIFTLLMMGLSTFLIGCLPDLRPGRGAAPILLVLLRFLQGLSAAGEQAGANSMTLEHAPERPARLLHQLHPQRHPGGPDPADPGLPRRRRAARGPAALLGLADPVPAQRRRRRGRLLGAPLAAETPAFEEATRPTRRPSCPLAVLFRDHWRRRAAGGPLRPHRRGQHHLQRLRLAYAVNDVGIGRAPGCSWVVIVGQHRRAVAIPLWATLSDRIGRRPVFIGGALGCAVLVWPYMWASAAAATTR